MFRDFFMITFWQENYIKERFYKPLPAWAMAEKYYNCDNYHKIFYK